MPNQQNHEEGSTEFLQGIAPDDLADTIVTRLIQELDNSTKQGRKAVSISSVLSWDEDEYGEEAVANFVSKVTSLAVQCGLDFNIEFRGGKHFGITGFA